MAPAKPPGSFPRNTLSPRRRRLFIAVLGAILLACLFAALEIAARLWFPNPFEMQGQLLGMIQNGKEESSLRPVPGWEGQMEVEGNVLPVRLNSLGLRGPEIEPRREDELRVLCLGDSFVFGYGVAAKNTFPAVLDSMLEERLERPIVVGNAGVPGYGTREQAFSLIRLKEPFDPDVVVSTIFIGNDFMDDQVVGRYAHDGFLIHGGWATLLRRSFRARLALRSRALMWLELKLIETGSRWALEPNAEQPDPGFPTHRPNLGLFMDVIDENHSWDPASAVPVVPRALAKLEQSLSQIRETAGDAKVLVVIMPGSWHLDDDERLAHLQRVGLDPKDYRLGLTQERIQKVCQTLGLPVVDITTFARELDDPMSLYLEEDLHLNPAGHRFVAELLRDRIAAMLE